MDSEREFAQAALSDAGLMRFRQRVREALSQGLAALPPDSVRGPSGLHVAAVMATDYSTCHKFAAAYLAAQVTEWIDSFGEDAAIARLRHITGKKRYPVILPCPPRRCGPN
jgi:hypothetical protein